jgi:hypothetical protein
MSGYDSKPDTRAHIDQVRSNLRIVIKSLMRRAAIHDESKLHEPELATFDSVTERLRSMTYGSPEYKACLADMGPALKHHYAYNDHHPEHFVDETPVTGEPSSRTDRAPLTGVVAMDLVQLTEMLCDWQAATKRHDDGDIRRSILVNAKRFGYGDEIRQLLLNTVSLLEGE